MRYTKVFIHHPYVQTASPPFSFGVSLITALKIPICKVSLKLSEPGQQGTRIQKMKIQGKAEEYGEEEGYERRQGYEK